MDNLQKVNDLIAEVSKSPKWELDKIVVDLNSALSDLTPEELKDIHNKVLKSIEDWNFKHRFNTNTIQGVFNSKINDLSDPIDSVWDGTDDDWREKKRNKIKPNSDKNWLTRLLAKKARKKVELSWYQKLKLNLKEVNQSIDDYFKTKEVKDDYKRDMYDKKLDNIKLESNILFSEIRKDHLDENWQMLLAHDLDYQKKAEKLKKLLEEVLILSKGNNELRVHLQSLSDDLSDFMAQHDADLEKDNVESSTKMKEYHNKSKQTKANILKEKDIVIREEELKQKLNKLDTDTSIHKIKNDIKSDKSDKENKFANAQEKTAIEKKDHTYEANTKIKKNTIEKQKSKYQHRKANTQTKTDNIETELHKAKEFWIYQVKTMGNKVLEWTKLTLKSIFKRKYWK